MFLRPRNHPGLATSLVDLLRRHGRQPRAHVKALFIPPNLAGSERRGAARDGWAGDTSFADTVGALIETEILEVSDDRLSIAPGFVEHLRDAPFADRLAPWLLDMRRTGPDPSVGVEGRGPTGDVAHNLTWFMDLDPLGPWVQVSTTSTEVSPIARLQEDTGRTLPADTLNNPSDWALFIRWSVFLGFAELRPGRRLDPDPTVAIDRVLDEALPDEMSVARFLERLAEYLPVFGGHLERSWTEASNGMSEGTVRSSLANALLRLEESGRLSLDPGVDEDDVVIFEFGRFEPVLGPEGTIVPRRPRYARIRPGGNT